MKRRKAVVAPRSTVCRICKELTAEQAAEVNAAIWPEPGVRARHRDYRASAQRACSAQGLEVEVKTVTRHADHVERTWRVVDAAHPARPGERPVVRTDFQSLVDQAATIGAEAMVELRERVPGLDSRDLVAVAKLGVGASATRESLRLKAQEVDQTAAIVSALTGLASGHITEGDIPDTEVINVTPPEVLLATVQAERSRLERLAAGEADGAG